MPERGLPKKKRICMHGIRHAGGIMPRNRGHKMTVSFHGNVKEHTQGAKSIEVADTQSVRTLIDLLGERFGGPFREFLLGDETCFFLVNGSGIMATGGLNTPLHAGDTVEVLPFVDGG